MPWDWGWGIPYLKGKLTLLRASTFKGKSLEHSKQKDYYVLRFHIINLAFCVVYICISSCRIECTERCTKYIQKVYHRPRGRGLIKIVTNNVNERRGSSKIGMSPLTRFSKKNSWEDTFVFGFIVRLFIFIFILNYLSDYDMPHYCWWYWRIYNKQDYMLFFF